MIDDSRESQARVPDRFREVQWTMLPGGENAEGFVERVARLLGSDAASGPPALIDATTPRAQGPVRVVAPAGKSIAVLPFANMSAQQDEEHFSDGLAEEIINLLTRIPGLKVIARTSAFSFRGKQQDIRRVADTLGVTHVLEGSMRRAGRRLRITAQLIQAIDGTHLWSERYDQQRRGFAGA